ncbi:helix-turn-helix domain-containing protein [Chryseobacterium arthrosphaerae]|uniref:helix-turn-helix domain-containing protein n=1 Tax=Chryseobacterium arthrosphaerae TaxID=651561 RepID=UPI0023E3341B|nr:helix-turn-helix domain-containing protein [Chryseobacterium arthrosphaerae]WES95847.1 helix-turn-helix domain-containing protein [Chryseobacterium arthrosphaerae]
MENREPDYVKIFSDMISKKFPEKQSICQYFLEKERLSSLDVITITRILFHSSVINNKHKSYDDESIDQILEYQRKNKMTNQNTAAIFKLSRNTLAAWKKRSMGNKQN